MDILAPHQALNCSASPKMRSAAEVAEPARLRARRAAGDGQRPPEAGDRQVFRSPSCAGQSHMNERRHPEDHFFRRSRSAARAGVAPTQRDWLRERRHSCVRRAATVTCSAWRPASSTPAAALVVSLLASSSLERAARGPAETTRERCELVRAPHQRATAGSRIATMEIARPHASNEVASQSAVRCIRGRCGISASRVAPPSETRSFPASGNCRRAPIQPRRDGSARPPARTSCTNTRRSSPRAHSEQVAPPAPLVRGTLRDQVHPRRAYQRHATGNR